MIIKRRNHGGILLKVKTIDFSLQKNSPEIDAGEYAASNEIPPFVFKYQAY